MDSDEFRWIQMSSDGFVWVQMSSDSDLNGTDG